MSERQADNLNSAALAGDHDAKREIGEYNRKMFEGSEASRRERQPVRFICDCGETPAARLMARLGSRCIGCRAVIESDRATVMQRLFAR